ncbi:hypothetical protein KIH27_21810 [Mycobacterium sp. M1]|uniref:Uncharacterized protein n=1 Tax=Mycolicibacter acidiphilus TaxID=2835306 RepID=A0ABS5RPJ3_9MYCO|nr:hypothetical protein [Mycolicibacter acidiphilus]MBS9536223.1 hypothetical protein [Mycolicibacter acidiphilus]
MTAPRTPAQRQAIETLQGIAARNRVLHQELRSAISRFDRNRLGKRLQARPSGEQDTQLSPQLREQFPEFAKNIDNLRAAYQKFEQRLAEARSKPIPPPKKIAKIGVVDPARLQTFANNAAQRNEVLASKVQAVIRSLQNIQG